MDEKSVKFLKECLNKAIPDLDPDHLEIIDGLNYEQGPMKELCKKYKLSDQKTADLLSIVGAMQEPTAQIRVPDVITLPTSAADDAEITEVTEQKPTTPKWVVGTITAIFLLLAGLLVLILSLHTCNGKRMDGLKTDIDTFKTEVNDTATKNKADIVQLQKEDASIHGDISMLRMSNMAARMAYETLLTNFSSLNNKMDLLGARLDSDIARLEEDMAKKALKIRLKEEVKILNKRIDNHFHEGAKEATPAPAVPTHKLTIRRSDHPTFVDVYKPKPAKKPAKLNKPASTP